MTRAERDAEITAIAAALYALFPLIWQVFAQDAELDAMRARLRRLAGMP